MRRVGSIAIVHETLSQNLDERVDFDEIADRVLAMVAELSPAGSPRRRSGRFGILAAEVATPLSMVLTEMLQNALEHGFGPEEQGAVEVHAVRGGGGTGGAGGPGKDAARLLVTVQDDGRGLPEGFDPQERGQPRTPDRPHARGGGVGRRVSTCCRRPGAAPGCCSTCRSWRSARRAKSAEPRVRRQKPDRGSAASRYCGVRVLCLLC